MTDRIPETYSELWEGCFVASNYEEAAEQAARQFAPFEGKEIRVDRLTGLVPGRDDDGEAAYYDEVFFEEPWPLVRVEWVSTDRGWDVDVLLPEWYVTPVDPEQRVVTRYEGRSFRLGDLEDPVFTAPGIGTADGFGHKQHPWLIWPVEDHETAETRP